LRVLGQNLSKSSTEEMKDHDIKGIESHEIKCSFDDSAVYSLELSMHPLKDF
jgi:hypothetical protein